MADDALWDAGSGLIDLDTDGNITLGGLATTTEVQVTTVNGAIIDGGNAHAEITAATAALRSLSGIGDAGDTNGALETVTSGVSLTLAAVTDSGDIQVTNTGALIIGTVNLLVGVTITDAGDANLLDNILIRAASPHTVNSPVTNNAGGNITETAEGSAGTDDLTINADITATGGNGNINLYAGDTISLTGTYVVSAAGSGAVLGMAGTNYNAGLPMNGTNVGDFSMADGSTIQSQDGNITLRAPGNVSLSIVNANSNTDGTLGDVIVTADYAGVGGGLSDNAGTITDNLSGEAANIIGDQLALRAGSGIGDGEAPNDADIDVRVNTLAAVTESGDIHVQDLSGGLTIDTFDLLSGVTILDALADNSGNDHITIRTSSPLTVAVSNPVVNNDGGNITLAAEGNLVSDDLTINANITITGGDAVVDTDGNIALYAGDSILLSGASDPTVSTDGAGTILVSASTDFNNGSPQNGFNATAANEGDVSMGDGSTISSDTGNITLRGDGSIILSLVSTNVSIIATADFDGVGGGFADNDGAITDNRTGDGVGAPNLVGASAALRAKTGIGAAGAIDAILGTVAASNTIIDNIWIDNFRALGLSIGTVDGLIGVTNDDLDNTGTYGEVIITNVGPITVANNVSSKGDITLTAFDTLAIDAENVSVSASVVISANNSEDGADGSDANQTAVVTINAGDNVTIDASASIFSEYTITINVDNPATRVGADPDLPGGGEVTIPYSVLTIPNITGRMTTINGGDDVTSAADADIFNIAPQNGTPITIHGGLPILPVTPGDTLNLNLNTLSAIPPTLTVWLAGAGIFSFPGTEQRITYFSIEDVNVDPAIANYHLVLDPRNPGGYGDNAIDTDNTEDRLLVQQIGTDLVLSRTGPDDTDFAATPPAPVNWVGEIFRGDIANILSLTIEGSDDNDIVTISDAGTGGLPTFAGVLPTPLWDGSPRPDNGNLAGIASLLFRGRARNDALNFSLTKPVTYNQTYALGDGAGGGFGSDGGTATGEILTDGPGLDDLQVYFTGLEPITTTGTPAWHADDHW